MAVCFFLCVLRRHSGEGDTCIVEILTLRGCAKNGILIDAYSQVLTHASQYPNVRGEDVRSIFLSTFINVSKNGGKSNAA